MSELQMYKEWILDCMATVKDPVKREKLEAWLDLVELKMAKALDRAA